MNIARMNKGNWGKVRAFFDVRTQEGFIVKGFKLVEGINGKFVGFPSQKDNDGEYRDTVWLTQEFEDTRRELTDLAIAEYNKDNSEEETADDSPTNDSKQIPPETSSEDVKVEEPFSQDDLPF